MIYIYNISFYGLFVMLFDQKTFRLMMIENSRICEPKVIINVLKSKVSQDYK